VLVISPVWLDCSCLASTQEEADTRIIFHALYSDKLYQENNVLGRIVVKSPDTDVLVLLVHYFPNMKNTSELWFQTGLITSTNGCRRYIPVHELCNSLSSVVCKILPADHALTGCALFFGIRKNSMSKSLVSSLGGSLTKVESLTVSNFTCNLFRSIWHRFDFPFGSYSLDISFRLRSTESFYSRQITKLIG
jgi:hypothetical protein